MLLRVTWKFDPPDPKNTIVINPCFRRQLDITDPTSGADAQALCDDLLAGIKAWQGATTKQVKVTAYNLEGAAPHYPMATSEANPTNNWAYNTNPVTACCLSFYGDQNIPRKRGRLYVPMAITGTPNEDVGFGRPSATVRTKVAALVPIFAGLGGTNVDWIVWSRVSTAAHKVEHWFVDDSWDVIRSRKVKATTRDTGTTSG